MTLSTPNTLWALGASTFRRITGASATLRLAAARLVVAPGRHLAGSTRRTR
jgi:hypothetical protein